MTRLHKNHDINSLPNSDILRINLAIIHQFFNQGYIQNEHLEKLDTDQTNVTSETIFSLRLKFHNRQFNKWTLGTYLHMYEMKYIVVSR